MLTCEASVDLVVARPEPEDSAVQTLHPVHGGGSHLLKVVSTVLAAEEVANVAPDGLEDFLSLGYGREETRHRGPSGRLPLLVPSPFPPQARHGHLRHGPHTPAPPMRGPGSPCYFSTFQVSL